VILEFLVTCTDAEGKRETIRIQASSSREALERCTARGYTDLTLHTDDAAAVAVAGMPAVDHEAITPAELVQLRSLSSLGFFWMLYGKSWNFLWWAQAPALAWLAYGAWRGTPMGWLGWVASGALLFPPAVAAWLAFFGPARKYDAMLEAMCWGRWQEVLDRIPMLRGTVPDFELDMRSASALVGLGRFDEGMAMVRAHGNDPAIPLWMYLGRMSELYDLAHRYDEALQCHRDAWEEAPDNPTVVLDYALALLKQEQDTGLAMQLIDEMENQPKADLLVMVLPLLHGMAALNSGRDSDAANRLKEAEKNLRPMTKGSALVRFLVDITRTYRAIALAKLGRGAEADRLFAVVRPRLEALNYTRLLERYHGARGLEGRHP
jgi:tetratricopeptide (TPR) repeat protein